MTSVLSNMDKALMPDSHTLNLTEERMLTLRLAALLHDADDRKYFKNGSNNAEIIVAESLNAIDKSQSQIDNHEKIKQDTLMMIKHVSASKNGNKIPEEAVDYPEVLWPRCCDRLEAIGPIGAVRCYQYNFEVNTPLDVEGVTPRPKSAEEMWSYVVP